MTPVVDEGAWRFREANLMRIQENGLRELGVCYRDDLMSSLRRCATSSNTLREVLVTTVCFLLLGCFSVPKESKPEAVFRMGQVERFEIVDRKEPIDFEPIVIADEDQVRTLAEGYRDLEWKAYLATTPIDRYGYALFGFSGDEKVVDLSVSPWGGFMDWQGSTRSAYFDGDAKLLFERLLSEHRPDDGN